MARLDIAQLLVASDTECDWYDTALVLEWMKNKKKWVICFANQLSSYVKSFCRSEQKMVLQWMLNMKEPQRKTTKKGPAPKGRYTATVWWVNLVMGKERGGTVIFRSFLSGANPIKCIGIVSWAFIVHGERILTCIQHTGISWNVDLSTKSTIIQNDRPTFCILSTKFN